MSELNKYLHKQLFGKCLALQFDESGIISTSENCKQCGESLTALHYVKIPDYRGNIAEAFQVVEKMREKGFVWSAYQQRFNEIFLASFTKNDAEVFYEPSVSLSEAICKAAKLALEKADAKTLSEVEN